MEAQEKGIKQDKINYEWGRGEVQKEEEEERKRREEEEKHSSFARHSDDAQMNAWMKEASRWGDPMAGMAKVRGAVGRIEWSQDGTVLQALDRHGSGTARAQAWGRHGAGPVQEGWLCGIMHAVRPPHRSTGPVPTLPCPC